MLLPSSSQTLENKAHELDAQRSELLALAVQESGTGVWDRNVVTDEIYYSSGWKQLFGYVDADISVKVDDSVNRVHPDDRAYVLAAMQAHFDLITPMYRVEHRLRCKDGSYKWVRSQGRVVSRDAEDRALRMVGTTIDITETKALASQLHDAAELVRLLTDEIPGMVYTCQRTARGFFSFLYLSAGTREIYEVEPEEAMRDSRTIFLASTRRIWTTSLNPFGYRNSRIYRSNTNIASSSPKKASDGCWSLQNRHGVATRVRLSGMEL